MAPANARTSHIIPRKPNPLAPPRVLQIARTEKSPELRKKAIFWLGQRKDPRVKQFLLELLSQ